MTQLRWNAITVKNCRNMRPSTANTLEVYHNASLYKVNAVFFSRSQLSILTRKVKHLPGLFVKHSQLWTEQNEHSFLSLAGFVWRENDSAIPKQLRFGQDTLPYTGQRETSWNRNKKSTCFIQVSPCGSRAAWTVYQGFETEGASSSSAMADFIMCTTASPTVMCQNALPGCVSGTASFFVWGFFFFAKVLFDFMPVC